MNKAASIAISLILGAVVGFYIGSQRRPVARSIFNPLVIVGPKPKDVDPQDIVIAWKAPKPITWRTLGSEHRLQIAFPEKGFPAPGLPPPFEDMASADSPTKPGEKPGKEWLFKHHFGPNVELSGALNPDLKPFVEKLKDGEQLIYVYDQLLDGERADGRIIIEK